MTNLQSEATLFKDHEISPSMGDKNYLHRKKIFKEYNTGQGDLSLSRRSHKVDRPHSYSKVYQERSRFSESR